MQNMLRSFGLPFALRPLSPLWLLLFLVLLVRLASLQLYPLMDATDAAYFDLAARLPPGTFHAPGCFLLFRVSMVLTCGGLWLGLCHGRRSCALPGLAGLALGLLTQGPLVLVLVGLTLAIWISIENLWRTLSRLPWAGAALLLLAIAAPWYVMAEVRAPCGRCGPDTLTVVNRDSGRIPAADVGL